MRIPTVAVGWLLGTAVAFPVVAQNPSPSEPVIALAPIGAVSRASVEELVPAVREAFSVNVVIASALPLRSSAYDRGRGQYLSTALLDALERAKRPEWERLLGVADVDLFVPRLHFVFGEGDFQRGVAVFSLARLRSSDPTSARRRATTEALHELGHTYGLAHCDNPRCVMWFSNNLSETDRKGTRFCPTHAAQLARLRRDPFLP